MTNLIQNVTFAAIILLIVYIISKAYVLYTRMKNYPTGDLPLPLFGNMLSLYANLNRHPAYYFGKLGQKYGGVSTFWLGSEPVIIVTDYDIAKSLLNKTEVSDRLDDEVIKNANYIVGTNFVINNYDEELKMSRKLSIEAIRKFITTDKFTTNASEIVTETVNVMLDRECGKQFIPFKYYEAIFVRLLIRTTFGFDDTFDSPAMNKIVENFEILQEDTVKVFACYYFPLMKLFHNKSAHALITGSVNKVLRNWYQNSLETYHSDSTESLSHLMHSAKLRYLSNKENKKHENYLSDSTIISNLITVFFGGSDTSINTFKWIILLMAYYPEMQQKMREEVKHTLNDKCPDLSDREKCHFVNAFICETLRFRNAVPLGVSRRTNSNVYIGDKQIPKGIQVIFNNIFILNDPKYWTNPEVFSPERFIDSDGCFSKKHLPAFMPFSSGTRICVGDKFALNVLFMVLTRFLQTTQGFEMKLANKQMNSLEPKPYGLFFETKPYKIVINKL